MSHINELVDYCVEVFVVFENKVLLRFHDKYNIWLSVGGHVEPYEDPNQAAIREVKEEVGLDVVLHDKLLARKEDNDDYKELIPPYFLNIHRISETHKHIAMVYFARANSNKIVASEIEKSKGIKWMTKEEIEKDDNIKESVKLYALKALEELSN